MPNQVQTYALHDSDPKKHGGAKRIRFEDAKSWNEKGYGIFLTVNAFWGPRRINKLVGINAWAVDLDSGTKEEMLARIKLGLIPTMVVESKRSYHVYWKARDGTAENWPLIVKKRLVPFYQADKKAAALTTLLRWPGFYHMKNPNDPFLIKKVWYKHVEYSEKEMFSFYQDLVTPKEQKRLHNQTKKDHPMEGDFWERVYNLDCEYALSVLSGSEHVGCETFEFKPNSAGTKQIIVNGKSTSSWIDADGRIGSSDEGGPTIAQWLNWYHKDYSKVVQIIKETFPECKEQQQMKLI